MNTTKNISNTDQVIDSRDVIARIEELESILQGYYEDEVQPPDERDEPTQTLEQWIADQITNEPDYNKKPKENEV
jgi:hypothetical protein